MDKWIKRLGIGLAIAAVAVASAAFLWALGGHGRGEPAGQMDWEAERPPSNAEIKANRPRFRPRRAGEAYEVVSRNGHYEPASPGTYEFWWPLPDPWTHPIWDANGEVGFEGRKLKIMTADGSVFYQDGIMASIGLKHMTPAQARPVIRCSPMGATHRRRGRWHEGEGIMKIFDPATQIPVRAVLTIGDTYRLIYEDPYGPWPPWPPEGP